MNQERSAQGQVSQALRAVIADFGPQVLGNPDLLGNLLKDHIPDHPREINVLQAAAQSGAAAAVDDRIRSGMQPAAAIRMTAAELSNSLAIDSTAAEWGVAEFAQALGYVAEAATGAASAAGTLAVHIPPVGDAMQLSAAQLGDQVSPATIAAQVPPLATAPQWGYPPQQLSSPVAPPTAQRPPRRTSRGPLIASICAVVVVLAAVGGYFVVKHSTQLTGAKCLVGNWQLQSAHQSDFASGYGNEIWYFKGGSDDWMYGSAGTGTVTDSRVVFGTSPSATTSGRDVSTGSGTFNYHVVGSTIDYNSVSVPGMDTLSNLTTGKSHTYTDKTLWDDSPDKFTCSGNTLVRSGSGYSFTYVRQ
jgi:hypothetical protein